MFGSERHPNEVLKSFNTLIGTIYLRLGDTFTYIPLQFVFKRDFRGIEY